MNNTEVAKKSHRIPELEGLRALAAIVVVFYHACLMFYPSLFFGVSIYKPVHNLPFERFLYGQPFMGLVFGVFSVAIFFVLSGFVLSVGYFGAGGELIVKKLAAKRYLRLMLPALASIIVTWFLLSIGLGVFKEHAQAITQSNWLIGMWSTQPNLNDALWQGVVGIFQGNVSYNPVLWTMQYELMGSFMIFGSLILFGKNKYRWVLYAGLILGFYSTWYFGFVIGMILADLYAHKKFPFNQPRNKVLIGVMTVFGIVLGGFTYNTGLYRYLGLGWLDPGQNQCFLLTLGAMLVVIGVMVLPCLKRFFGGRFMSGLGKYTFSLYLMHVAVLFTVCVGLFTFSLHHLGFGYNKAALSSFILTIPVLALVVYWFEKYIDAPSISLAGKFSHFILQLPQTDKDATFSAYSNNPKVK